MENEQKSNELKSVKIHLERIGNELEVNLEGSIEDWLTLLVNVSKELPHFKKAIELTAGFFEFDKQQND